MSCEHLVSKKEGTAYRCQPCKVHRKTLCALMSKQGRERVAVSELSSHANYRYFSSEEKDGRIRQLHQQRRLDTKKMNRLKTSLEEAIQQRGLAVDSELHREFRETMSQNADTMSQQLPEGSFSRMFWENQLRAAQLKDARSMRWDPIMIRWCLYLRHLSGRAYDMMRESGVVNLPSQRTLRDYTYHTHASTGFSAAVDQQLVAAAGLGTCPDRERSIVFLMDEMHIREDIVYPVSGKPYNYTTEHANLLIHFIQTF